jgi:RNA polymerase sigma-70 factor, ECF subfamily
LLFFDLPIRTTTTMSLHEIPQALALLKRIASKDESAIAALQKFIGKRLYLFALNRLHDEQQAEAIVSETLFAVWEKPQGYSGDSSLSTWLHGIAKNKIRMLLRDSPPVHEDLDDFADQLESEQLGPFDLLANHQYGQHMLGCLDTLPGNQTECLQFFYFEDWSVQEIANFQNVPEGTIKSRLNLGRKSMKTCLERALQSLRPI